MIHYKRSVLRSELEQILELQKQNIPEAISPEEKAKEGFVTVHHELDILTRMNDVCSHVIAVSDNRVVGYALCMHPQFEQEIAVLRPMFIEIKKHLSPDTSFLVMGQICIEKAFRKQGIFRGLYKHMQEVTRTHFDVIITEVDLKNLRSLHAHYAVGFEPLASYRSGGQDWELIVLRPSDRA